MRSLFRRLTLIPSWRLLRSHPSRSNSPILSQTKNGKVILRLENVPGELEKDLTQEFVEEPCGLMAKHGFGYIQAEFEDRIGPDNRYEILRKFGWGMYSSVWLAKDTADDRFVAIKVLTRLAHLHSLGIAHTDLRPENILMDLGSGSSAFDIASFIKEEPTRRHPPERTWGNKFTQVAVSQPFPVPAFNDWISRSYVIGDFGSAQFVDKKVTDRITPEDLRAPETVLVQPWNEKVDIWTFGCLAFEFLADQKLMKKGREEWDPDRLLLFQMLVFTEDRLPAETIRSSKRAMEYLDPETAKFLDIFKKIGSLQKHVDIDGAIGLLEKCIRLDPKDRYSAKELLEDPWLNTET